MTNDIASMMTEIKDIETYGDLLNVLKQMSEEQLKQKPQICPPSSNDSDVIELMPVIGLATVDQWGLRYCRSSNDNRRNGGEIVMLTDHNSFALDGACYYEFVSLKDPEDIKDDDLGILDRAIYPKDHSPDADWTGPAQKIHDIINGVPDGSMPEGVIHAHDF